MHRPATRQRRAHPAAMVLFLAATLLCSGCHRIFPFDVDPANPKDTGVEVDGAAADLGGLPDALSSDVQLLPNMSCEDPKVVGSNPPVGGLQEPALRTNGLELLASENGTWLLYQTIRPDPDQDFGAWAAVGPRPWDDPTFFLLDGQEQAVVSHKPASASVRQLEYCFCPQDVTACNCTPLTIIDQAAGAPIIVDTEGPSVAVTANGLLMAHNVWLVPNDKLIEQIYLATPTDPADPSQAWTSAPLVEENRVDGNEDDPALSPDGLVLLFGGATQAGDTDIWVSQRGSLTDPFSAPEPLEQVNSVGSDREPYLAPTAVTSPVTTELFFRSNRDGTYKIYRSVCTR